MERVRIDIIDENNEIASHVTLKSIAVTRLMPSSISLSPLSTTPRKCGIIQSKSSFE